MLTDNIASVSLCSYQTPPSSDQLGLPINSNEWST